MDSLWGHLQLIDVRQDVFRNIVSLRVSQNLFDDLADTPEEQAAATHHEMATKPPVFSSPVPIIERPFEQALWYEAVAYPFDNWQQSRYSRGRHGVWYGADSIATTVYESAHHWRRFLRDADLLRDGVAGERRVHTVRCDAALLDLRPHTSDVPDLVHPTDYTFCQQFGERIHREGHPGLLTRSARCEGEVFAVFNPRVLSNPRAVCYLSYRIHAGCVEVERIPGERWLVVE